MGMRELTIGGTSQGETGATADIGSLDLANIGEDIPDRPALSPQDTNLVVYGSRTEDVPKRQELRRDSSGKLYWAEVPWYAPNQSAEFSELK